VASGAGVTAITSAISDGSNRLMLIWGYNAFAANPVSFVFNAAGVTSLSAGGLTNPYFGWIQPGATTANITANYSTNTGLCVEVFLNGINAGSPIGTVGTNAATSANVSVTMVCTPGDLVIAGFSLGAPAGTVSARGAGQTNLADLTGASTYRIVVDSAYATGTGITFTWTLSGSQAWGAAGIAVKTA
jgi:hypothetical protein